MITAQRTDKYYTLNTQISQIDGHQLALMLDGEMTPGWGGNNSLIIGEERVFAKRIPVTETEYQHMFSTRNHYDLPGYFNYGVGSFGKNVFRELQTYIKTTNWALNDSVANFPLLYHYRIIPAATNIPAPKSEQRADYVQYWNSNENIGRYFDARVNAPYELVLFLEYIPHTLSSWIGKNRNRLPDTIKQVLDTLRFVKSKGLIHMDLHLQNILTDGNCIYFSDFGLAIDQEFELSEEEHCFYNTHLDYDLGIFLFAIGKKCISWIFNTDSLVNKSLMDELGHYGITRDMENHQRTLRLLKSLELIKSDGKLALHNSHYEAVLKCRDIALFIDKFVLGLQSDSSKDVTFCSGALKELIEASGY